MITGVNSVKRLISAAIVLACLGGALLWFATANAASQSLQQLMAALAQVKTVQSTFRETKTMQMLSEPLQSSGKLVYRAPDYLEKRVLEPQSSYYIVNGNDVSVGDARHPERHLVLFQFPALEAFIAALRGTLAGDLKTLKEYYDVEFTEVDGQWTLQLQPTNDEMRLYVKQIRIYGSGDKIRQIDTLETNDDNSVMVIEQHGDNTP